MSAKERDRLKVLHEVKKRHITQKQAAAELGLSVRWVRKLLLRLRAGGDAGLRHGLRGRRSNRKTSETVKQRAVELYREKKQAKLWHDYGHKASSTTFRGNLGWKSETTNITSSVTFRTPLRTVN